MSDKNDGQTDQLRDHFLMFDRNGDGFIDASELGTSLRSLGFHIEEKNLNDIIADFDRNKDGKVDFDEFTHLINVRMKNPLTEEELKDAFHIFDRDNNGRVTVNELKKALTNFGEKLTDAEAEEFLQDADTNGDGELDIHELTRFLLAQKY